MRVYYLKKKKNLRIDRGIRHHRRARIFSGRSVKGHGSRRRFTPREELGGARASVRRVSSAWSNTLSEIPKASD